MREAATAGVAVTSSKPNDSRKITNAPASRLPVDDLLLSTSAPQYPTRSILEDVAALWHYPPTRYPTKKAAKQSPSRIPSGLDAGWKTSRLPRITQ
jgi:hypothetical protein